MNNSLSYGIGYADAADPGNPAGLSSGEIEIMYTRLGDANLDGKVNGTDFNILAANFNTHGDSWDQGDFNYDGKVNGTDFNMLAANFNQGGDAIGHRRGGCIRIEFVSRGQWHRSHEGARASESGAGNGRWIGNSHPAAADIPLVHRYSQRKSLPSRTVSVGMRLA